MMTAAQMALWTNGQWTTPPTFPLTCITQDSRKACLGALYVALKGERLDGHDFVATAFKAGATAAMVRKGWAPSAEIAQLPLLVVEDPAQALKALAKAWRASLQHLFVLGVTGSAGKTTVKELAAAMFSGAGKTCATPGNYNNEVGVPLSLLTLENDCCYGVLEAGISHPHDMDPLADMIQPSAAIVSSIGPAHIEFFGTEQAIAAEKAKLLAAVPRTGFVVLSKETHEVETLAQACTCRIVTCSLKESTADWVGEPMAKGVLRVYHADEPAQLLETGLSGEHNASNVLLAYATVREAGLTAEEALKGLATFQAPKMRWERTHVGDIAIINDAYNANPLSMRAALETFAGEDVTGPKVVCVGDMLELGQSSDQQHYDVGFQSGKGPWRLLVAIGTSARALLRGAIAAGYPDAQTAWFATTADAAEELPLLLQPDDTLLLKASRGMHLETLLDGLNDVRR